MRKLVGRDSSQVPSHLRPVLWHVIDNLTCHGAAKRLGSVCETPVARAKYRALNENTESDKLKLLARKDNNSYKYTQFLLFQRFRRKRRQRLNGLESSLARTKPCLREQSFIALLRLKVLILKIKDLGVRIADNRKDCVACAPRKIVP